MIPDGMTYDVYAQNCPTRMVLDRLADKWVVLILLHLSKGRCRFNALRRAVQGVSQKVLSQTLKALERDGLITREAFATVPVTVEYAITPLGTTLVGTLDGLRVWAESNMDAVISARAAFDAKKAEAEA
ncbi:MAG: winged helix-turn-helix transcriptional regulator [Rhodospirillaceae bacterium]